MKALLTRLESDNNQTLGIFQLFDDTKLLFQAKSLELPWNDNKKRISCIPVGFYETSFRTHGKYANKALHVKHVGEDEVLGRSDILIHSGNYKKDTLGCILLGQDFLDIDGDGFKDITNSSETVRQLIKTSDSFTLKIIDLC